MSSLALSFEPQTQPFMTRPLPRAPLHSSKLVRFLTENDMSDAARDTYDVGQKLGDWLNFRQAIALHSVLNPELQTEPTPDHARRAALMTAQALSRHVNKIRTLLEQAIVEAPPPGSGIARIDMPPAELDEPIDPKAAFTPYRRFYAAQQRQMEACLQKLRAQVRTQLGKSSSALQQLAALDAAFETILSEREAALLANVPKLHEKRFVHALKRHAKKQADAVAAGETAMEVPHKAWLMPMRQALRTALLAELDTRLQPTLGLLEAFNSEHLQQQ